MTFSPYFLLDRAESLASRSCTPVKIRSVPRHARFMSSWANDRVYRHASSSTESSFFQGFFRPHGSAKRRTTSDDPRAHDSRRSVCTSPIRFATYSPSQRPFLKEAMGILLDGLSKPSISSTFSTRGSTRFTPAIARMQKCFSDG